jgi:hypothetical protein
MSGELTKLKIEAFKKATFKDADRIKSLVFTAMFNPTTFSRKLEIDYEDGQGVGTSAASKKFNSIKPGDFDIELLIDGTGASGPKKDVAKEIEKFMDVCAKYYGKNHRPNYLMISWVKLILKAVLTNVDVSYTMFAKDGTPLRAKITASFAETIDDDFRVKKDKNESPDLTHVRVVKEGDTLPLMTERIYGNDAYYLEVAKANKLRNFRNLKPGTELFFPPIVNKN